MNDASLRDCGPGPDGAPDGGPQPVIERRAPRWMKLALLASLALNLAVVGLVAGAVLRGGHGEGPPRGLRDGMLPLAAALAPEDRRAVGRDIRHALRAETPRRDRAADLAELLALLRAETFDTAAFSAALQAEAARGLARVEASQAALIAHLERLSREDRLEYAARVEAALDRRRETR